MLSTVVLVSGLSSDLLPGEAVVRSLASLVPGVIEGVLRDVTLAGPQGHPELAEIAAHAGCGLVEAPPGQLLSLGIAAARGPHVFLLEAGFAPEQGYIEEFSDLLSGRFDRTVLLRSRPENLLGRFFPDTAQVVGLIGSRERLAGQKAKDIAALARGSGRSRTLKMRGRPVI